MNLIIREDDVIQNISPNDGMLSRSEMGGENAYLKTGQSALKCIDCSLQAAQISVNDVKQILDLPCGHGRVLRYLKTAFPEAQITACDLLHDAVDFCASTFGAIPVYSNEDVDKIPLERNAFDLIWVGSLLTHLDSDRWPDFLNFFRDCLRPGGVLIFSTHGCDAYYKLVEGSFDYLGLAHWRKTAILQSYKRSGFGYANYLDSSNYGLTFCKPSWVITQLTKISELRVVHFSEKAWDNFHDIFACVRELNWQVQHPSIPTSILVTHKVRDLLQNTGLAGPSILIKHKVEELLPGLAGRLWSKPVDRK